MFECIKGKLLEEYQRKPGSTHHEVSQKKALKTQSTEQKYKNDGNTPKETRIHFICSKQGHIKPNCFICKNERKEYEKKGYNNHKARSAINMTKGDNNPKQCFITNLKSSTQDWYADSGTTCHMTNDRTFFTELQQSSKDRIILKMQNFSQENRSMKDVL